jgi:hypothetical protein
MPEHGYLHIKGFDHIQYNNGSEENWAHLTALVAELVERPDDPAWLAEAACLAVKLRGWLSLTNGATIIRLEGLRRPLMEALRRRLGSVVQELGDREDQLGPLLLDAARSGVIVTHFVSVEHARDSAWLIEHHLVGRPSLLEDRFRGQYCRTELGDVACELAYGIQ